MITGVTFPTKGEVTVNGTVSALLELTAGFDMALTGRENIHLRGHAMGLDADEIAALEPKVVEFADLGVYIDQPVRTYSSGMKSRLGFAFAVSSDPEILVVDEALSVGDKQFQQKCFARVREIMEDEDVTVLFSHPLLIGCARVPDPLASCWIRAQRSSTAPSRTPLRSMRITNRAQRLRNYSCRMLQR